MIRDVTPNVVTFSVPFSRFGKIPIGGRGTLGEFLNDLWSEGVDVHIGVSETRMAEIIMCVAGGFDPLTCTSHLHPFNSLVSLHLHIKLPTSMMPILS